MGDKSQCVFFFKFRVLSVSLGKSYRRNFERNKPLYAFVRLAPLQNLGTLPIRFTRAFSEEELRNHLDLFEIRDFW